MKIERKYMAHYLNAAFGSGDASYTRLGSDLEEYSPELTANVEKKSNIVGETTVTINGSSSRTARPTVTRRTGCRNSAAPRGNTCRALANGICIFTTSCKPT